MTVGAVPVERVGRVASGRRPRLPARAASEHRSELSPTTGLLRLQHTAGNRAVVALILRAPDKGPTAGQAAACAGYERGEVRRSRSPEGYHSPDVRDEGRGMLLVTDFGVGSKVLRRPTQEEPLFREWRSRFEQNDSYRLKIFGFSDCVGRGGVNETLRYERATAVYDALLPGTQSRVTQKGPFGPTLFLVDNLTAENRATNRGVLVAFQQQHEGDVVPGEGDLFDRVVKQSRRALTDSAYDKEFMGCWLDKLQDSGFDDLYVNGFAWGLHTQELEPPSAYETLLKRRSLGELEGLGIVRHVRKELTADVVPGEDISKTRNTLRGIANRYHKGIDIGAKIAAKYSIGGGAAINPGDKQLIDYIAASTKRASLHRCYLDFYSGG